MGSTTQCKWTKEAVLMLINLYKERPILFDCNHKDYYNRVKRVNNLSAISYYLKEFNNFSIEEIKNKIKCIRSQYSREKLLVEKSKQSGAAPDEVYEPTIWFYDLLHFLENIKSNPAKSIESKKNKYIGSPVTRVESETEKYIRIPIKQMETEKEMYIRSSVNQIETQKEKFLRGPVKHNIGSHKEKCFRSINNRRVKISQKLRRLSEERQSIKAPAFADCVGEELANIKDVKILRDTKKEIMQIIWAAQEKDQEKYEDLLYTYRLSETPTKKTSSPIPQNSSFEVDPLIESTYSSPSPSPIPKVTPVSICYLPLRGLNKSAND